MIRPAPSTLDLCHRTLRNHGCILKVHQSEISINPRETTCYIIGKVHKPAAEDCRYSMAKARNFWQPDSPTTGTVGLCGHRPNYQDCNGNTRFVVWLASYFPIMHDCAHGVRAASTLVNFKPHIILSGMAGGLPIISSNPGVSFSLALLSPVLQVAQRSASIIP